MHAHMRGYNNMTYDCNHEMGQHNNTASYPKETDYVKSNLLSV